MSKPNNNSDIAMIENILLHPHTWNQCNLFIREPAHALIISGKIGSGKHYLALNLINAVLDVQHPHKHQFFMEICVSDPRKPKISVDQIRTINEFLKRKTYGQKPVRRVVLISDANHMTESAQNALLKILEEPPSDTIIVLATSTSTALLPTVLSRSQIINAEPVDYEQAKEWFSEHGHYKLNDIAKAFNISDGRMGLMTTLLENSTDHPLITSIKHAKNILSQTPYERLLIVDNLSKDRHQLQELLEGLTCTLVGAMKHTASENKHSQTNLYFKKTQAVQNAREAIAQNANMKLVLTDLFFEI